MESLIDIINAGDGFDGMDDSDNEMPSLFTHSVYFDSDQTINFIKSKDNPLSLFSLNCQSLHAKFDQLLIYTKLFDESHCPFSVICLQETWLKDNADLSLLQLEGYDLITVPSSCSAHGGVCMYIRSNIEYRVLNVNVDRNLYDALFVEIVVKNGNSTKRLVIGNIYRPPRNSAENYRLFNLDLDRIFVTLNRTTDFVLVGDFNIDLLKINEKNFVKDFFDNMISNGFIPKITFPTRTTDTSATLIDNCFIKTSNNLLESIAGILKHNISDHQPIFVTLNNINTNKKHNNPIRIFTNTSESKARFKSEIESTCNIQQFETSLSLDPNRNYDILDNMIQAALEKHMPIKTIKYDKHKHKKNSWISNGIVRSIRFRDKLYSKLKSTDPSSEMYSTYKINLQTYNRILKQNIRQAKKLYYQKCFEKFKKDIKGTWMTIKQIINRSDKIREFPKYFNIDNIEVSNPTEIATKFNDYFTEIGPKLAESILPPQGRYFTDYLKTPAQINLNFTDIDEKTVLDIIDSLKPKSSYGVDRLSNKLVKLVKYEIAKPLTLIINQCFHTGIFPDKLKIAKVLPIFKKNDNTLIDNYRPVSILPSMSKIFERVMYNQIYNHFLNNKLFFNSQYGFRSKHSTELAALELIDKIITKMDHNEIPLNIYLDLSKAFDTLDHNILLHKLSYYGIKGISLNLLKDYLTNRKQFVEFGENNSKLNIIRTGVPQGSILGPLLFIIYLNDLVCSTKKFYPIIYADDTALSTTLNTFNSDEIPSEEAINHELENINNWFKLNKLSLNPNKTKAMLFHSPQKHVNPINININGIPIEFVEQFNYLGIILDKHLTWKFHIATISQKISRTIGIMCKLKRFLPLNILKTLYHSLILPYLTYGILVWGTQAHKLNTLQNKSVRVMSNSKYNSHAEPIFKALGLLKITDLCVLQELKFAYKLENGTLPHYFKSELNVRQSDVHNHNTRNANNLTIPMANHRFVSKSIRFRIPAIYNDCDDDIKAKMSTLSIQGFSNFVKTDILKKYKTHCTKRNCHCESQ